MRAETTAVLVISSRGDLARRVPDPLARLLDAADARDRARSLHAIWVYRHGCGMWLAEP